MCLNAKHVLVLLVEEVRVHGFAVLQIDHPLQISTLRFIVFQDLAGAKLEEPLAPVLIKESVTSLNSEFTRLHMSQVYTQ